MKKAVFLILLLIASSNLMAQTAAVSYKQQSWELGNKLSQATLVNAMSGDSGLAQRTFTAAQTNAKNLGVKLPALPAKSNDKIRDQADALYYLLNTTGMPIMKILTEDFGAQHAALFELAFKTNILLMLYEPDSKETAAIVNVIGKRTESAGLPSAVFSSLLNLIAAKAQFDEVKNEIFLLQKMVPVFVASEEFGENGILFYEQKNYAGSVTQFSKALELLPDEPKYHFLRARSYMQLNKNAEAISDYTKVIQFARSDIEKANLPTVYKNRGLAYGLLNKNAQAVADLNMSVKLNPNDASAYKIRSLIHKQMGSAKLADADYRKAESLQPGIMRK